jgi:hypothetical protein
MQTETLQSNSEKQRKYTFCMIFVAVVLQQQHRFPVSIEVTEERTLINFLSILYIKK